jgi:hypothetical protein
VAFWSGLHMITPVVFLDQSADRSFCQREVSVLAVDNGHDVADAPFTAHRLRCTPSGMLGYWLAHSVVLQGMK